MTRFRLVRRSIPVTVLCIAVSLTGCQTMGENASSGTMIGGVLGCLGGAAIASATGGKPGVGCAAGAALGAVSGYYVGRKKDMDLALKAQNDIRRLQADADVKLVTARQDVPEGDRGQVGGASSIEVLNSMVVSVPHGRVARKEQGAIDALGRVGNYVSEAQATSRIVVGARSKAEYDFMVESIQKGYTRDTRPPKVTFEYQQLARSTQATVEVRHIA